LLIGGAMSTVLFTSCVSREEKPITVVARRIGSGTREAFDRAVTDGKRFLEERDAEGNAIYRTVQSAVLRERTADVISEVKSDANAIGYISVGALDDSVRLVRVDGFYPTDENLLNGKYPLWRPFVILTSDEAEQNERTRDFLFYLESERMRELAEEAGCVFLTDTEARGGVAVRSYEKKESLPGEGKILIRGATSAEKMMASALKSYAALYGVRPEEIADLQLEGSLKGKEAVLEDREGSVIGISSAFVEQEGISSFSLCLEAIAVVVNPKNQTIHNLTLEQIYRIFSGEVTKFSAFAEET
jgi:phosphate transport system substrate-binding protein